MKSLKIKKEFQQKIACFIFIFRKKLLKVLKNGFFLKI